MHLMHMWRLVSASVISRTLPTDHVNVFFKFDVLEFQAAGRNEDEQTRSHSRLLV